MMFSPSKKPQFAARFQRYECKYLITESEAEGVCRYIRPFVTFDPYAAKTPDHSYDIMSLYLDAPDLKLFRETQEGVKNRIKLRIRSYNRIENKLVFMEIKRRRNGLVLKGRARIQRTAMAVMLAGGVPDVTSMQGEERACYDEFVGWVARWLTEPVIWVKYRREAYVGAYQPGIRVTLDRQLQCAPAAEGNGSVHGSSWRPLEREKVVLELKFNQAFPRWMHDLVRHFNLKQQSYSKYGKAVNRGLDAWLRPAF